MPVTPPPLRLILYSYTMGCQYGNGKLNNQIFHINRDRENALITISTGPLVAVLGMQIIQLLPKIFGK
jgi:hypothetical protein